jgi:hypothetical protein
MLSRREWLLLCCSMASALLLVSAADSPTKVSAPPDGSGMGEAQCMMDSLQFLPYIKLTPDFRPGQQTQRPLTQRGLHLSG